MLPLVLSAVTACGSTTEPPSSSESSSSSASSSSSTSSGGAGGGPAELRGDRYCEILLGTFANGQLSVDVYSTEGLNDCPADAWSALDTAALKTETMVDIVVLNGPRYWMIDSLAGSTLLDETPRTLGGIPMRKAGAITVPTSDLATLSKPYTQHTIHRDSEFHFLAGKAVFELVDPQGLVYDMQSYNVQTKPQTEASLADLGAKLTLPQGWSFKTRVLDVDLVLKATNGTAIVVQDDYTNTYSLAQ
jgi:hypothetical protein